MSHDVPSSHAPLTPEERTLAAVARALPSATPSPELDARILAASRVALDASAARARRRHWALPRWGVGSAAAALLAVGVVWQMRQLPPQPPAVSTPSATAPAAAAPITAAPSQQSRPVAGAAMSHAAPPEPVIVHTDASRSEAVRPDAAKSMPTVPAPPTTAPGFIPAPPPTPVAAEGAVTRAALPATPPQRTEPVPVLARPSVASAHEEATPQTAAARVDIATNRAAPAMQQPFPHVHADARLAPDAWLQRIRARRAAGDIDSARASLQLFRRDHARHAIPDDLRPLLSDADQTVPG